MDKYIGEIIRMNGVVVKRGENEITFFENKKDAGSWLLHYYGVRLNDAKNVGLTIESIEDRSPKSGDLVQYKSHEGMLDFRWNMCRVYFNAGPFRIDNFVDISGGPAQKIDESNLVFIGIRSRRFWRWHDDYAGANQGGNYYMNVPVWEYSLPLTVEGLLQKGNHA